MLRICTHKQWTKLVSLKTLSDISLNFRYKILLQNSHTIFGFVTFLCPCTAACFVSRLCWSSDQRYKHLHTVISLSSNKLWPKNPKRNKMQQKPNNHEHRVKHDTCISQTKTSEWRGTSIYTQGNRCEWWGWWSERQVWRVRLIAGKDWQVAKWHGLRPSLQTSAAPWPRPQ